MKRLFKLSVKALLLAVLLIVPVSGTVFADDNTINMVVSPSVLNIESNGGSISIHTDIGYVPSSDATLMVNGTVIEGINTFVDSCGNLVVKASVDTVKSIVAGEESAYFVLTCNYNGGIYTGTDSIDVIQVIPQKK